MSRLDSTFGATLDGAILSHVLYGITCGQTVHYYRTYSDDGLALKATVAFLWIMDTLQQCLLVSALWYYLISRGNGDPTALEYANWSLITQVAPSEACIVVVSLFYIRRIWILDQRKKWPLLLVVPIILDIVVGAAYIGKCFRLPLFASSVKDKWLIGISAGSRAIIDFVIAVAMVCILHRRYRDGITARFSSLIRMLIRYTLATGLLTSLLATAFLVVYVLKPLSMAYVAIYLVHGKIYVNSMLVALNSRKSFRELAAQEIDLPTIF